MFNIAVKFRKQMVSVALLLASASLGGCVVYPAGYGYGGYGGYGGGYYAPAPVVVAPPIYGGFFFGGGWHGGGWRR